LNVPLVDRRIWRNRSGNYGNIWENIGEYIEDIGTYRNPNRGKIWEYMVNYRNI
jgi:hypothetical protein